jgi:AP-2 complex subunit beta-1
MRALAIRTMTNISVKGVLEAIVDPIHEALKDKDPYVAKTAAIAVGKIYFHNEPLCMQAGLLEGLKGLLAHDNSMVVANTVAVLNEIARRSNQFEFSLDASTANKLLTACDEASEWSQAYILESVVTYTPEDSASAELFAERISPRLQHANSAIILSCVRIILHLINFMAKIETVQGFLKKLGPPLGTPN